MPRLSELYQLNNYIDTFALGHYARVLDAVDLRSGSSVAFKVMRPEHLDADGDMQWEYRAFGNEADILTRLWHSPNIVKLYDCGFISDREEAPRAGEITSFPRRCPRLHRQYGAFRRRWLATLPGAGKLAALSQPLLSDEAE